MNRLPAIPQPDRDYRLGPAPEGIPMSWKGLIVAFGIILAVALALVLSSCLTGCSTASPDPVQPHQASLGPNGAHSGVYAVKYRFADGSTAWYSAAFVAQHRIHAQILAQLWYPENRARYNRLIGQFGALLPDAPQPDDHLEADGAFWQADPTAITTYIALIEKQKQREGL